ncbi:MAG TPA: DNA polymerase III subunit beta [Puia sp.]|jgi:DNA polymerase-3 subunit beta
MKKLIINSKDLKAALQKLSQVIVKKPVIPALSNIYLRVRGNEVELITSDLELTISYVCKCECVEEFELLLPFEFVSKLVGLLPQQPITISLLPKNKGEIIGEGDIHKLGTLDKVEDFPKIPNIPSRKAVDLDASFMRWLERAMESVSKDKLRPAMTKALLEISPDDITIVSTDAHSLFRHKFPVQSLMTEQILISPKIALSLQGFETTKLSWNATHLAMKADNVTIIATRHNDKFPDYRVVIPNQPANLDISRAELISGINRVSLVSSQQIKFQFTGDALDKLTLYAENEERNSAVEVSVSYSGNTPSIAFAPELFKTLLHQIPFSEIRLHIDSAVRGVLITAEEDPDYLGMIMPLLLN